MSKKRTQRDKVLLALLSGEQLTKLACLRRFGCWNSGNIIMLLRRDGYKVKTDMRRKGEKVYAVYSMEAK